MAERKHFTETFSYQHFGKRKKDLTVEEVKEYNNIKKLESRVPEFREKERAYHRERYKILRENNDYKEKRNLEARINRVKYKDTKKRKIETLELALKMIEEDIKNKKFDDFDRNKYLKLAHTQIVERDILKYKEKRNIA